MSANISYVGGKAEFIAATEAAWWDTLGEYVAEDILTLADAIQATGLDWTVKAEPVLQNWNGELREVPNQFLIVRQDTGAVLSIRTERYGIIQNVEALEFADLLTSQGIAKFHSLGAIEGGKKIFASLENPAANFVVGKSEHKEFINVVSSHDGTINFMLAQSNIRVVCQNTLNRFLKTVKGKDSRDVTMRHTKNVKARMEQARKDLELISAHTNDYREKLEYLATRRMAAKSVDDFFNAVLGITQEQLAQNEVSTRKSNQKDKLFEILETNVNDVEPELRYTGYDLLNAITWYTDHEMSSRATGGKSADEARALSSVFGSGQKLKERALTLLLADGTEVEATEDYHAPLGAMKLDEILATTEAQAGTPDFNFDSILEI